MSVSTTAMTNLIDGSAIFRNVHRHEHEARSWPQPLVHSRPFCGSVLSANQRAPLVFTRRGPRCLPQPAQDRRHQHWSDDIADVRQGLVTRDMAITRASSG